MNDLVLILLDVIEEQDKIKMHIRDLKTKKDLLEESIIEYLLKHKMAGNILQKTQTVRDICSNDVFHF